MLHVLLKNFIPLPAFDAVIMLDNIEIFIPLFLLKLLISTNMKHLLRLLLVLTLGLLILSAYKIADKPKPKISDAQQVMIDLIFDGTAKILKGITASPIDYNTDNKITCGVVVLPDDVDVNNIIAYTDELTEVAERVVVRTDIWRKSQIDGAPVYTANYIIYGVPVQLLYLKTNDRNDLIFIVSNI